MATFVSVRQDGSVNIPQSVRDRLGIKPGASYEIRINGKGQLTYHPHRVVCSLCGAEVMSVDTVTGTCPYCKMALTQMVRSGLDLSYALKKMQKERRQHNI